METEDVLKFLKSSIEPIEDSIYGPCYRASVYLTDKTFIPCVIFRDKRKLIEQAIKRFDEERNNEGIFGYSFIVENFVARGNCINLSDIKTVEKSKFAFPLNILRKIKGETRMGWTGFAIKMKDGKHFGFGTSWNNEFFEMPENYAIEDITEIINHSYVLKSGELRSYTSSSSDDYKDAMVYRDKPFFECYLDYIL